MQLRRQAPNIEGMRIVGRARLRTALGRRVWRLVKHDGSEFAAKQVTSAADVLSTIAHQHASEAHSRADSRSDSRILSVAGGARAQLWWLTRGPSVRRDRQRTRLLRPRQFHLLVAGFVAVSVMGAWVAATARRRRRVTRGPDWRVRSMRVRAMTPSSQARATTNS